MKKNNEIISNFYLIRENGQATYVGYTNREVKQRFKEHLHDKDFTGDATVEELDSLSFSFTWDINTVNQYAQEVSDREASLISEYGTGTSVWQKGTSGRVGGQTWTDIKHFVSTNQDNPKFARVEEAEVVELIAYQKKVKQELQSVIGSTIPKETQRLHNVIRHTMPKETQRLQNVIRHTMPKEMQRLNNVIRGTKPAEHTRLQSVISDTTTKNHIRLKNVISHTIPKETQRLHNVIKHTIPKETQRLKNVIGGTTHKETQQLKDIIKNTRTCKK